MDRKLKILFLSALSPYHYGNLTLDMMQALEQKGHEVDYLTLNGFKGQEKNMFSLKDRTFGEKFLDFLRSFKISAAIRRYLRSKRKRRRKSGPFIRKDGWIMVNYDETKSPCNEDVLLNLICKEYDLVITHIWERMISARTLLAVYEKLKSPIIICPADTYPFAGGCQYFGSCKRYMHECGRCPILGSNDEHDQTYRNFLYKRKVYETIPCALLTNSYMMNIAHEAKMFAKSIKVKTIYTLNENVFKPYDMLDSRRHLKIPNDKAFVMFARFVSPEKSPRKGLDILFDAVNGFCQRLEASELKKICMVFAGDDCSEYMSALPITIINLQKLNTSDLIKTYSAATVFLSPSIDDAGPSMVNQSIMCGTPVVCFNIGTAIDVIKHKENGFKARLGNVNDFEDGLYYYYKMNQSTFKELRCNIRNNAVELQSLVSYADKIENTYYKLSQLGNSANSSNCRVECVSKSDEHR